MKFIYKNRVTRMKHNISVNFQELLIRTGMDDLVKILHQGSHSLVVSNGEVCTFDGRGVSDLYRLLKHSPDLLCGASLADRVVGKAAAALMLLGGVKEVYAEVVSQSAADLLDGSGLKLGYSQIVPNIINRTKTGLCPLETLCQDADTPHECLQQIDAFMKSLSKPNNIS